MVRSYITLIMLVLLATAAVGCGDGEQLQLDVQNALAKHTEMNNYRFSGSANLALERPDGDWSSNPLTAGILTMITNGQLSWEGIASVEPVRMELLLKLTPHSSSQAIDIPMLIKDNKMYLHIPAINEPEQYYEINLDQLSEMSSTDNPLSVKQLGNAGQLFSSIFQKIVSSVNPKRFEEITGKDADLRSINITLNQKHVEEAIDIWFTAVPEIMKQLNDAGYIQPKTEQAWEQKLSQANYRNWIERSDEITLNQPLTLLMKLDDEGYVRESHMKADITATDKKTTTKTWSVDVVNRYDDINQNPAFTQPIPTNVKPFSDILEFMSGKQNP
ncbi:MAG: hypothetical protein WDZ91_10935 [Paenibacillaceae bacterium]